MGAGSGEVVAGEERKREGERLRLEMEDEVVWA
jgi:hypothetical protein